MKGGLHPLYLAARVDHSWGFRIQMGLLGPQEDKARRKIFEKLLAAPDLKLTHDSLPKVSSSSFGFSVLMFTRQLPCRVDVFHKVDVFCKAEKGAMQIP
jgi:hypothetical protein